MHDLRLVLCKSLLRQSDVPLAIWYGSSPNISVPLHFGRTSVKLFRICDLQGGSAHPIARSSRLGGLPSTSRHVPAGDTTEDRAAQHRGGAHVVIIVQLAHRFAGNVEARNDAA